MKLFVSSIMAYNSTKRIKRSPDYQRLYKIFHCMHARCYNPNNINYKRYGMKGIKVCKSWDRFDIFYKWAMSNGYSPGLSIDRIKGKGNYSPKNCRWATRKEQNRNRKDNRVFEYQGQKFTMVEWAEIKNIDYNALRRRLDYMSFERAITMPYTPKISLSSGSPIQEQSSPSLLNTS